MFEKASRIKLRFDFGKGISTVEDVWSMSVPALKQYGTDLYNKVQALTKPNERYADDGEERTVSADEERLRLQEAIVNHIYNVKKAELKARKDDAVLAQEEQRLMELIARKQEQALENETVEQLQARLKAAQEKRKG